MAKRYGSMAKRTPPSHDQPTSDQSEYSDTKANEDTSDTAVTRHVMVGVLKVNLLDENVECYFKSSFGQFLITAEIIGEVTIDKYSTEPCSNAALSAIADKQGIDWSPYEKRIYLFPKYPCGFSATTQGGGAKVWSTVCDMPSVLVHELGHTFGLQHSAIDDFKHGRTRGHRRTQTDTDGHGHTDGHR